MKTLKCTLLLLSVCFIFSCGSSSSGGDDEDTTVPTITINSPTSGTIVAPGETLDVDIAVSDDTALSSYTISITFSSALEASISKLTKIVEEEFEYESSSSDISGTSVTISTSIEIDTDAASGNYIFSITVTDSSGNSSSAEVNFQIS